ncbi:hypothetical protein QTN25_006521 [Entamoeba marina]
MSVEYNSQQYKEQKKPPKPPRNLFKTDIPFYREFDKSGSKTPVLEEIPPNNKIQEIKVKKHHSKSHKKESKETLSMSYVDQLKNDLKQQQKVIEQQRQLIENNQYFIGLLYQYLLPVIGERPLSFIDNSCPSKNIDFLTLLANSFSLSSLNLEDAINLLLRAPSSSEQKKCVELLKIVMKDHNLRGSVCDKLIQHCDKLFSSRLNTITPEIILILNSNFARLTKIETIKFAKQCHLENVHAYLLGYANREHHPINDIIECIILTGYLCHYHKISKFFIGSELIGQVTLLFQKSQLPEVISAVQQLFIGLTTGSNCKDCLKSYRELLTTPELLSSSKYGEILAYNLIQDKEVAREVYQNIDSIVQENPNTVEWYGIVEKLLEYQLIEENELLIQKLLSLLSLDLPHEHISRIATLLNYLARDSEMKKKISKLGFNAINSQYSQYQCESLKQLSQTLEE